MEYQVVYSTRTGNTKKVAEAVADVLGVEAIDIRTLKEITAPAVAVGYWVDKGQPDEDALRCLESLSGKKVFLFGTLGAEPDSDHGRNCMINARKSVEEKNEILGEFICQGAIDPRLLEMFKHLPADNPHAVTPERKKRYELAASHPDEADLQAVREATRKAFGM